MDEVLNFRSNNTILMCDTVGTVHLLEEFTDLTSLMSDNWNVTLLLRIKKQIVENDVEDSLL